jgi:hypothetical protein
MRRQTHGRAEEEARIRVGLPEASSRPAKAAQHQPSPDRRAIWRAINHGQERRKAATTGHTSWQVRWDDGLFRSDSQADGSSWRRWAGDGRHAGGSVGGLPRTRHRCIHASRNLSRAPPASLRDRLRRPWTEPVCRQGWQQSGSGEGPGQGNGAASAPVQARSGGGDQAPRLGVGRDRGRHVARVKTMPLGSCLASPDTVPRTQGWQPRKGGKGAGNCRSVTCFVNRFVNWTRRDSTRRGRRSRRSEMESALSAEVTTPARDCPRRQRHMSAG